MTTVAPTKSRPIIFTDPDNIRALLDGTKTQTRRQVKPQPITGRNAWSQETEPGDCWIENGRVLVAVESRGRNKRASGELSARQLEPFKVGQVLWVKEKWCPRSGGMLAMDRVCRPRYAATEELRPEWGFSWRTPLFMPRWASRIELLVTRRWIERLHDISEADARAEACAGVDGFREKWERINGNWKDSPWVWCVEFKRIEQKVEAYATN